MRIYVNSDVNNELPSKLKSGIINTIVVSGHGSTEGETNFTSTDKLYLLDAKEIYGESFTSTLHTAKDYERQLDYYSSQNVTTSNYSGGLKQHDGTNTSWWLRSARSGSNSSVYAIDSTGYWYSRNADISYGVSPAFRLG